jgi:periplasmic protein TonB
MAPITKDVETLTPTTTPAVPSAATKSPQDATPRPQPVPLEVPVSVNGARTIEGTDKREPFSESTKTVLVFANGAVIRLASSVSPGQLLFVTNEKSKKEVVCQVVKSKNYRTVTGYVELEFTEPAAGFWGVRIPEQAAPPTVASKAPVATRPVAQPPVPAAGAPKAPVAVSVPPPAAVATKPNIPVVAPIPVVPPVPASVSSTKPEAVNASVHAQGQNAPKPESKLPTVAEFLASSIAPSPLPVPITEVAPAPPAASVSPANQSNDSTSDELRQQAARLQEQLSSLLFRAESAEKKASPAAVPASLEPLKETNSAPKPATEIPVSAGARPDLAVPSAIAEGKPVLPANQAAEAKPIAAAKSAPFNLKVEEVKIPSWLAPLARDTESATQASAVQDASLAPSTENITGESAPNDSFATAEERSATSQTVVFGGQLLGGGNSETQQQASSTGSKTGLMLGLATAALVIGGAIWYGLQPGNFLAAKSPAVQSNVANNPAPALPVTNSVSSATENATKGAPVNSIPSTTATARPAPTPPATVPTAEPSRALNGAATPDAKSANLAARIAPSVEPQKKSVLGDVRLATPNVNRSQGSTSSEAAPSIDAGDATTTGDPLAGIAASNNEHQPAVPAPVGGDVKPAQLLKSVPPIYPSNAKTQRVAGDVKIDALIDATGNVTTTKILSGPVLLHQAAAAAVKQWKYQPAYLDGKPTAMHLTVTVQFRLQ